MDQAIVDSKKTTATLHNFTRAWPQLSYQFNTPLQSPRLEDLEKQQYKRSSPKANFDHMTDFCTKYLSLERLAYLERKRPEDERNENKVV